MADHDDHQARIARLDAIERKLEVHTYMLSTLIVIGLGILWRVLR
jgi:hypothetical protein